MASVTKESLEAKIKKAEERVVKTGDTYNAACEELKNLRNKMTAIAEDNKDEIRKILDGNIYDVISYSESGGLMDEKEAREEFDKLIASASRLDDGSIEVNIPVLV